MIFTVDINKDGELCKIEAYKIQKSSYDKEVITIFMTCGISFDVKLSRITAITKIKKNGRF